MMFLGCIEIQPNGCMGKIIVKGLRVLVTFRFQIQRILVEMKLDDNMCVKIKKLHQSNVMMIHLLKNTL